MKTRTNKQGEEYIVFSYRIPVEKYETIKRIAKKNKRTINAEIDTAIDSHIEVQGITEPRSK